MSSVLVIIFTVVLMLSSTPVSADKVVVIPLFSAKRLGNIVTVAKSGGDFTDPVAAVNSITNAESSNPYSVFIGPGSYTLTSTLLMKNHVSIMGSGKDVTTLKGTISSDSEDASSAIVATANTGTLSDLSIVNSGTGTYTFALYSSSSSVFRINNVRCYAYKGDNNRGIFLESTSSSTILINVTSYARGSGDAMAYGLYISGGSCKIYNSMFAGFGGGWARGIYLTDTTFPLLTNVEAYAHDATNSNYGMLMDSGIRTTLRQCVLDGWTVGIYQNSGKTRVMNSSIVGGVDNIGGTLSCVNSNDGEATALTSACKTAP